MEEGARLSGLTGTLLKELAGNVFGACTAQLDQLRTSSV